MPAQRKSGAATDRSYGPLGLTLQVAQRSQRAMRHAALIVLLLAAAPARALPDFSRPGPYAVGVTTLRYTKPSVTTGAPRVLDTEIWYPTEATTGTVDDPARNATVRRRHWPLILFSHGSCGFPGQSPFFTAGLATWGFIVAAPPHPGNTTTDYPQCGTRAVEVDSFQNRVADITFVLDQLLAATKQPGSRFERRISPRRIGMSGHSFGGQTTLRVEATDSRVRGAVAMAPATITGLSIHTPTMVLGAQVDSLTPFDMDVAQDFALLQGPRFLLEIQNAGHCAFALACFAALCGAGCGPQFLPEDAAHRLTMRYAVPFFLRYVAGRRVAAGALTPHGAPPGIVIVTAHPGR